MSKDGLVGNSLTLAELGSKAQALKGQLALAGRRGQRRVAGPHRHKVVLGAGGCRSLCACAGRHADQLRVFVYHVRRRRPARMKI